MKSPRFAGAVHGFSSGPRRKPQYPAAALDRTATAAVIHSNHLDRRTTHITRGIVNKTDPASSAEVRKSSTAVSAVVPTIMATNGVRFICHRDCNAHAIVEAEPS